MSYSSLAFGTIAGHFRLIVGDETGAVRTMPVGGATCPEMDMRDFGATIQNIVAADVTGDGRSELIVGTQNAAEVAHIGLPHETRGDVDGDTVITANDVDELVDYLFGAASGLSTTGDANPTSDSAARMPSL